MKTQTLLLALLLLPLPAAAQIGINTQTPAGIFHVAAHDSVIISTAGNVGIGLAPAPAAKLDILANSPAKALQIIDGLQQQGHLLTSDAQGNARWNAPIGSAGQVEALLPLGPQTIGPDAATHTPIPTSSYAVKADGHHVYEIRWYARYTPAPTATTRTGTHLQLIRHELATGQSTLADQYEMRRNIAGPTDAITFWATLTVSAKAGDILTLQVRQSIAPGNASLTRQNTPDPEPAKIIVKRLNIK
jgi:hypothetical protein